MSLLNKLESLKAEAESKKAAQALHEGKDNFANIVSQKNALLNRFNELSQVVSGLKSAYGIAESDLASFKKTQENIGKMYGQYSESLSEHGINSASEMLNNPEFSEEPEVKEYFSKSPARGRKNKEERGNLGKSVEKVSNAKKKAAELMPDANLSFAGAKKEGADKSPREESFDKMREELAAIERELALIKIQEEGIKAEYLPKIERLVNDELDKIFASKNYSIAENAANIHFIPDQIFDACEDFWPEAKEVVKKVVLDKFYEMKINIRPDGISESLEAEKLIYDVNKLKKEYGDVLRIESDNKALEKLVSLLGHKELFNLPPDRAMAVRSGMAVSSKLLEEAEEVNEKNPGGRQKVEEATQELLAMLKQEAKGIKVGLFDKRDTENEKKQAIDNINKSIKKLEELKIPDYFFNQNRYEFTNKLGAIEPDIQGSSQSISELVRRLREAYRSKLKDLEELIRLEGSVDRLSNDIYNISRYGGHGKLSIGGFDLPAEDLKQVYSDYPIFDSARFKAFFDSLEGKKLNKQELEQAVAKEVGVYQREIDSVPGASEAIRSYQSLLNNDKRYSYDFSKILDMKMNSRKNSSYKSNDTDPHKVKQQLFDLAK